MWEIGIEQPETIMRLQNMQDHSESFIGCSDARQVRASSARSATSHTKLITI
mgnify:CR=1 FL=1